MRAIVVTLTVVAALLVGLARATDAEQPRYKIIVHPENPTTSVDRDFLRDAYLKKSTQWRGGATLRPVDLATSFPVRERFTSEVIKKTPSQLRSYWNQRIFSGKGVPPPEVGSVADMIGYVMNEPGAIGYIPATMDEGDAKVIGVK